MSGNGKRLLACLLAAVLLTGAVPAHGAAPSDDLPIEEAKGYIFALRDHAPALLRMEETPGVEPISAAQGVYWADTLEEIAAFVPAELLEYVVPDYAMETHAAPNDPEIADSGKAWSVKMLHMDYAWENNFTGKGVRVGIVDSGIRRTHADFSGADINPGTFYPSGYDTGSKPGSEDPADPDSPTRPQNAHGTFVAGLLAATADNGEGLAGVAPGVELVPLVAFEARLTYLSAVVKAIYGGVDDYDCDVLNMSLGIYKDKPMSNGEYPNIEPLDDAIAYAQKKGVILVASVGNNYGDMLSYPAAYPGVIGVGSVDKDEKKSGFSQYNDSVFVMAPGDAVYSLDYQKDSGYTTGSGTSYASPQVAAAVALALELDPNLTSERIMELLAATAKDLGDQGRDDYYGHGLLDVSAFLEAVAEPWVETAAAPGGLSLTVRYCRQTAKTQATVWCAAYDKTGRMVDADTRTGSVSAAGTLSVEGLYLDTTADAATVRVFLWDAKSGAPLGEPINLALVTAE